MPSKNDWTTNDMPNQSAKIAIVTGANSGTGYETARALAHKGASVIMACRSQERGDAAVEQIRSENPDGSVELMLLDLGDLDSVRGFTKEFRDRYERLDLLINNAGIMVPPFGQTAQGFETQFGVNHLGHFALTGLLLDIIVRTPQSRIVMVSSMAHKFGKIDFDNLNGEKGYRANRAYSQSKLANLLFAYELQRRLEKAGSETIAVAAHPGWTATNLQQHTSSARFLNQFFAQTPEMGALPILRGATAPDVKGGEYYGPAKRMESVGYPVKVESNKRSHDVGVAAKLWSVSEKMTEVHYPTLEGEVTQVNRDMAA